MADHPVLSTRGRARRDAMLAELTTAMRTHHTRRRRRRRVAVAGAALAVIAAIPTLAMIATSAPDRAERMVVAPAPLPTGVVEPAADPATSIICVRSDPSLVERYAVHGLRPSIERIDDDGLLDMLAMLDRRAGLVRNADGVRLTKDVTDAGMAEDVRRPVS